MTTVQNIIDYFLDPTKTFGYDVPKTLAYGTVLIIAVYLIFLVLKKLKIEIDQRLFLSVSPYIVLGGILRVMQDAGILTSYWLVTPGIYFFIFSICFAVILISSNLVHWNVTFY